MTQMEFTEKIADIHSTDKERRRKLAALLEIIVGGQKEIDLVKDAEDAGLLKELVESETFKILVIGEFNTGKSTFINALLGREILPTKAIPATAIINELRYGPTPRARLHFTEGEKAPIDIPIEKLNEYVLIHSTDREEEAQEEIKHSPFSHAEIWWPLEMCKDNNVEIIDSPGLNEDSVREKVTYDYLKKVDAIVFLMSAVRFGPAQSEMAAIEMMDKAGHQDIFFVVNQWDRLRPREREEVQGKALSVLKELTTRKNDIYFVSALDALEGRAYKDPELEKKSGFQELEASLHQFLAEERSRMKALRSSRQLRRVIRKMEKDSIPKKVNLLSMPLGELQSKYEAAKKDLQQLETDKRDMLYFMNRQQTQIISLTRTEIKGFFYSVDQSIDLWAENYEVDLGIIPGKAKLEEAIKSLSDLLVKKLQESFEEWELDTLRPFIEDRMDSLYRGLQVKAMAFENHLMDAHFTLTGTHFDHAGMEDEFGPKNALERILAGAGGFLLGGVGMASVGAVLGYQEMLKALLPNIAAVIAAMVIGLPVLPLMLAASFISGRIAISKMEKNIKAKVIAEFKSSVRKTSSNHVDEIVKQLEQKLEGLHKALELGMDRQIGEVKEQAETALADHRKGQAEVDDKLAAIDRIKIVISQVDQELEEFIDELVNPESR